MQEHPGKLTVGGVADSLGAQAGTIGATVGVGSVALGAVREEELMARGDGLGISREGIFAGAVFVGHAMQPFAIEHSGLSQRDGGIPCGQYCKAENNNCGWKAEKSEFAEL